MKKILLFIAAVFIFSSAYSAGNVSIYWSPQEIGNVYAIAEQEDQDYVEYFPGIHFYTAGDGVLLDPYIIAPPVSEDEPWNEYYVFQMVNGQFVFYGSIVYASMGGIYVWSDVTLFVTPYSTPQFASPAEFFLHLSGY